MIESKILIPIDFTAAADKAIEFGIFLAHNTKSDISLLHACEDDSLSPEEGEAKLKAIADKIIAEENVACDVQVEKGKIFSVIPEMASKSAFKMMVIGTHGRKGIRQKLFGPDILKLIKRIPIPVLVVQENSTLPDQGFKTLVFPAGGHKEFDKKIEASILFSGMFDPEIHIYSVVRPGVEYTDQLKENIKLAEKCFTEKGINFKRVTEDQAVFSVGYAKQTLQYMKKVDADLIAIMSIPTQEHAYFADSDKEVLLTNEMNIPVLCTSDVEQYL